MRDSNLIMGSNRAESRLEFAVCGFFFADMPVGVLG
jgi:hypothetical protein